MVTFSFLNKLNFFKENTVYSLIDKNNNFTENTIYKNFNSYQYKSFKNECLDGNISNNLGFRIYTDVYKKYDENFLNNLNLTFDYIQVDSGFLGREYMKTSSIYYFNKNYDKDVIIEIQKGNGYIILENIENIVKIKIIKVKEKSKIIVPAGFAFVMVNKSDTIFSALILRSKNAELQRNIFQKVNGTTLFYVKNKGFIRNENVTPFYHLEEHQDNYLEGFNIENNRIYEELIRIPEKFNFLR